MMAIKMENSAGDGDEELIRMAFRVLDKVQTLKNLFLLKLQFLTCTGDGYIHGSSPPLRLSFSYQN